MNYLKQINGFWIWRKLNSITHVQMDLYFAILDCANTALWKETFCVPNSTLMNLCQLSKSQLHTTRNQLVQLGLIDYTAGKKGQAGSYKISPLMQTDFKTNFNTDFKTGSKTDVGNIIKGEGKVILNGYCYNNPRDTSDFKIYTDTYNHDELEKLTRHTDY